MPERLELRLGYVAGEHEQRQTGEPEPAGAAVRGDQLMRDQTVGAHTELALHPTVFVDFRVERARRQRRELARGPFEIDHSACGLEVLAPATQLGPRGLVVMKRL